MPRSLWLSLALGLALGVGTARADVWDLATDNDNNSGTDNELIHGTSQVHDLGVQPGPVADEDWFRIGQKPESSYEILVDSTSGDIGFNTNLLQRVDATGTTVIQNSVSVTPGLDYSHSLRFANTGSTTNAVEFIRVGPGNCGTSCDTNDVYHIRMMETTVNIARFNNAGSQVTVLLTQNASEVPINATFFYWDAAGNLLQTGSLINFPPKQLNVFALSNFPTLVGKSGHITVANDAPYGQLNIKCVALEPSTGFSFDTPGVYRGF
jgi:hypothetical protein